MSAPAVHPSAVVDPRAQLGDDVTIGPFVVIEGDVEIGDGCTVLANSTVLAGARLGPRCRIGPQAVVAMPPNDFRFRGETSLLVLGEGVVVREFTSLHRATGEGEATRIGAGTLLMPYAHVGHNGRVGRGCTLTNGVQIGGHAEVGDHAVLGAWAMVHQGCRVGDYAMFGAASATNQDILPYALASGRPAVHFRTNKVGLQRHGIDGDRYRAIERALRALRRKDRATFESLAESSADVARIRVFEAASRRGVARFVTQG